MRCALIVAVMFASASAYADGLKPGRFNRVGGWAYTTIPNQSSCGKAARDFLRETADGLRSVQVGQDAIKWGASGEPIKIQERDADSVTANRMATDVIKGTEVTKVFGFNVSEEVVIMTRIAFARGEIVCADAFRASIEREP